MLAVVLVLIFFVQAVTKAWATGAWCASSATGKAWGFTATVAICF